MKINDLLKYPVVYTTYDIQSLKGFNYNHIPEVKIDNVYDSANEDEFVRIDYFAHRDYDSRRVWELGAVYFKDECVMIIQNAGREGDDHSKRFIVDNELFISMCQYLQPNMVSQQVGVDDEIEDLAEFYGDKL